MCKMSLESLDQGWDHSSSSRYTASRTGKDRREDNVGCSEEEPLKKRRALRVRIKRTERAD